MRSRPMLLTQVVLTLVAVCVTQAIAQDSSKFPPNTGIFQGVDGPLSPTTRFLASERGKQYLLHSSNPAALGLLHWFHPDAVNQWPQEPLRKSPVGPAAHYVSRPGITPTGCGTTTGTVMNLEPATNAVGQYSPGVDFILSELGSGKDLVAEYGQDNRFYYGVFDSMAAIYVHRDGTQDCYGGTDFEMSNPPITDPNDHSQMMMGTTGQMVADPNSAHKQFIFADTREDQLTSGVGLWRMPTSNWESTSKCPAGTLNSTQSATCAGTNGIIVFASEDNFSDSVVIAQDPRTSGTGAGDIYVVSPSVRELRTVILLSVCKATFASISDCSNPIILSGSTGGGLPSVTVVGGGPNAGAIGISYATVNPDTLHFLSCTPNGAPNPPTCTSSHTVTEDDAIFASLTNNPLPEISIWPQLVARTDSGGQTFFLVWSDCKAGSYTAGVYGCPESQIVMATNTSLTSPAWTLHHIYGTGEDRFSPSAAYDPGQGIVTVGYYATVSDAYKNSTRMAINQVPAGSTTPGSTVVLNTTYDSLQGDGTGELFGLEKVLNASVAAHGGSGSGSSRVYVGFTSNARQGTYTGTGGSFTNTQADNAILRATY